jgi:hypothetical protein
LLVWRGCIFNFLPWLLHTTLNSFPYKGRCDAKRKTMPAGKKSPGCAPGKLAMQFFERFPSAEQPLVTTKGRSRLVTKEDVFCHGMKKISRFSPIKNRKGT